MRSKEDLYSFTWGLLNLFFLLTLYNNDFYYFALSIIAENLRTGFLIYSFEGRKSSFTSAGFYVNLYFSKFARLGFPVFLRDHFSTIVVLHKLVLDIMM